MKKLFHNIRFLFFLPALLTGEGCKKAEDIKTAKGKPEKELVDKYQVADGSYVPYPVLHLYSDTVYTLTQTISRNEGEQLIIDPGTVIRVSAGGALVSVNINAGGQLQANGTATEPVVFTSDVQPGTQSLNWGGILITGKSVINSNAGTGDPNDLSGSLTYLRIEFAGLHLNAVGLQTVLSHIQVSYSANMSSFEIDGGNFNADHLISYACDASADFYLSQGYAGKMQFLLACRHPYFGKNTDAPAGALAGLFIENTLADPAGQATPVTAPVISNLTVLGPENLPGMVPAYSDTSLQTAALITTRHSLFHIGNSVFAGFPRGGWFLNDAFTADAFRTGVSSVATTFFETADSNSCFFLEPGSYDPYNSTDFRHFVLNTDDRNQALTSVAALGYTDITDFTHLNFLLIDGSVLQSGADFTGPYFSNSFFSHTSFMGAFGMEDWTAPWANFIPLKTNYNFPQ